MRRFVPVRKQRWTIGWKKHPVQHASLTDRDDRLCSSNVHEFHCRNCWIVFDISLQLWGISLPFFPSNWLSTQMFGSPLRKICSNFPKTRRVLDADRSCWFVSAKTTCASRVHWNFVAPFSSATRVHRAFCSVKMRKRGEYWFRMCSGRNTARAGE